ncbi:hypothetical protein BSY15_3629 [Acidovorax sp. RAC01]|nr:hypothetical protein BSY15_3629 [Acidovorax sp. RAC01]
MQPSPVRRFLPVALVSLLALMPLWYYLAAQFAAPVFFIAGEAFTAVFRWAQGYESKGSIGVLNTSLKVLSVQGSQVRSGTLAPAVDYRLWGYGMVIFWALLVASRPRGWGLKLLTGTAVMLPVQAISVGLQWSHDVFNRAGADVFVQTRLPGWWADVVAFLYHFNLFIFAALAPVVVWLWLDRSFVAQWRAIAAAAASRKPR